MADQKGLRTIAFGFSVITAAVILVAALVVADAVQTAPEALALAAMASG